MAERETFGDGTQYWAEQFHPGHRPTSLAPRHPDQPALNVKVKKFNQARVNGGSNYDSLKVTSLREKVGAVAHRLVHPAHSSARAGGQDDLERGTPLEGISWRAGNGVSTPFPAVVTRGKASGVAACAAP